MMGGHAVRRKLRRLFPDIDLATPPNVDAEGDSLWLEAVLWAADGYNRSATKATTRWRSPYEVFFRRPSELQVVLIFQPGMMRAVRGTKSDAQSVP